MRSFPQGYLSRVVEIYNCNFHMRNNHLLRLVDDALACAGMPKTLRRQVELKWEAELMPKRDNSSGRNRKGTASQRTEERVQAWFASQELRDAAYVALRCHGQFPFVEKAGQPEKWNWTPSGNLIDCVCFMESVCQQNLSQIKGFQTRCPFRHSAPARSAGICYLWARGNFCVEGVECPYKHPGTTVTKANLDRIDRTIDAAAGREAKSTGTALPSPSLPPSVPGTPEKNGLPTCVYWIKNHCVQGDKCRFVHPAEKQPCPYTVDHECFKGAECPFKHRDHVVRYRDWTAYEVTDYVQWMGPQLERMGANFAGPPQLRDVSRACTGLVHAMHDLVRNKPASHCHPTRLPH